jgi:hypothetical protein
MTSPAVRSLDDIPGWFPKVDQRVFEHFLGRDAVVTHGDLVEIGAYLGKSAVLIGAHKHPDETFTVCDLFGAEAGETANQDENSRLYQEVSRARFEQNYQALRGELPVVVADLSSTILDHVKPATARFVHVDGSHMYEHVAIDIDAARTMLVPDGIVVFDDYRSAHTPGVSGAVWEAVFTKGLHIVVVTSQKMYATFGAAQPHRERTEAWLAQSGLPWEKQTVGGQDILRIKGQPAPPKATQAQSGAAADRQLKQVMTQLRNVTESLQKVTATMGKVQKDVAALKSRKSLVERGWQRARRAVSGPR